MSTGDWMLGILLYLPNIYFVPHYCYLLAFIYMYKREKKPLLPNNMNTVIIFSIVFVSLLIRLLCSSKIDKVSDLLPWFVLIPVTYYISLHLNKKDLKVLLILAALETVIVVLEFIKGVPSFFINDEFPATSVFMLYFNRPYGLGNNSSGIAFTILFSFYILEILKPSINKYARIFLYTLFSIGMLITFNRTAILSFLMFNILLFISKLASSNRKAIAVKLTLIAGVIIIAIQQLGVLLTQFTRDSGEVDLSGRDVLWKMYLDFISEHFLLGNGTFKYLLNINDKIYHAHNSYLQILATSGIFILVLYMIFIFKNINRYNICFLLPILVASLTQNLIFWGISTAEVYLFFFLCNPEYHFNKEKKFATFARKVA